MSSRPPANWQKQLKQGLGEGNSIGPAKSRYHELLCEVMDFAEKNNKQFTEVMIDILEDFCKRNGIELIEPLEG